MVRDAIRRLRKLTRRLRYRLSSKPIADRWREALPGEVEFWGRFLDGENEAWADDVRRRLDPDSPLQDDVRQHIDVADGARVRILDVGSGPLTTLGKTWPGHEVEIVGVDPLADQYVQLLRERGLRPLTALVAGDAETLPTTFGEQRFDLVYSCNALDHCYDPITAVRRALELLTPGGKVVLRHMVREADHRDCQGLHQWNFWESAGDLMVESAWESLSLGQSLQAVAAVRAYSVEDPERPRSRWVEAVITPHDSPSD